MPSEHVWILNAPMEWSSVSSFLPLLKNFLNPRHMRTILTLAFAFLAPLPVICDEASSIKETQVIESAFTPGQAEASILKVIGESKKTIRLAAYSFTSPTIAKALVEARKRGVDVQAVLDKSQKTEKYSGATFLKNEEIPVRINSRYAIMHNKFIVIDGKTVQTGSFNYTSAAAKRNAENVVIIRNNKDLAKTYTEEWERLWKEAGEF
jgi:phosphatidylserine/phosphatidylglycerophosphate/cardiolipin synthase-like enzyme